MKSFVKSTLAVSILAASSTAMANDDAGFYGFFSLQQAEIDTSIDMSDLGRVSTPGYTVFTGSNFTFDDESIPSASIGAGYMFNSCFGIELAYNVFNLSDEVEGYDEFILMPRMMDEGNSSGGYSSGGYSSGSYNYGDSSTANMYMGEPMPVGVTVEIDDIESLSLAAVGEVSAGENFHFVGKLGVDYWEADVSKVMTWGYPIFLSGVSDSGTDPFVSFGFRLNLNDNWSLTNDYTWRKFSGDDLDIDIRNISLGIRYDF